MNKKLYLLTALLLLIAFVFVSCGEASENCSENNGSTLTDTEKPNDDNTTEDTPTHSHTFGGWITVKDATCNEQGEKKRACACGEYETESIAIDAENHAYGEWIVTSDPTCLSTGNKERYCTVCSQKQTEIVEKDLQSHIFGEWTVKKPATCTVDGENERICACGASEKASIEKDKSNHVFGEWVTVTAPTCVKEGVKEKLCACGEKTTSTIEATGNHSFENSKCTVCNAYDKSTDEYKYALLKEKADAVAPFTHEESAVAWVIEQFGLQKK